MGSETCASPVICAPSVEAGSLPEAGVEGWGVSPTIVPGVPVPSEVGVGGGVVGAVGTGDGAGVVSVVSVVVVSGAWVGSEVVVVTVVVAAGALGVCALGSWVESVVTSVTGAAGGLGAAAGSGTAGELGVVGMTAAVVVGALFGWEAFVFLTT